MGGARPLRIRRHKKKKGKEKEPTCKTEHRQNMEREKRRDSHRSGRGEERGGNLNMPHPQSERTSFQARKREKEKFIY